MSQRPKKKRQKTYHGVDAAPTQHVTHYQAEELTKRQEWWREHKQVILVRTVQVLLAIIVAWIVLKIFT